MRFGGHLPCAASLPSRPGRQSRPLVGALSQITGGLHPMNPSALIEQRIAELNDGRGPLFVRLRMLIRASDPAITEEWKWNSPVWSRNGLVVSLGVFKDHLKLNFFQGASLSDPHGL